MPFRSKAGRAHSRLLAAVPVAATVLGVGFAQPSVASATVDTTPPHVSFLRPTAGQVVKGMLNDPNGSQIDAPATDNVGVTQVDFSVDGQALNVERYAPYTGAWDTTKFSDGQHTLTATAFDAAGNKASASVNVTVANTISTTAPLFNGAFTAGQAISRTEYPRQSFVTGHVTAVPDPSGSGKTVAKYAIANSDQPYSGSHPRGDMLTANWYTQGSTLFTSIPVEIPTGLPAFHNSGSSFFQWAEAKDTAASFPSWGLGLSASSGSSQNSYVLGTTNAYYPWVGPTVDGKWHTAIIEAYYTSAPGKGWFQMWWDGQPVTFNRGASAGQTRVTGITTITDGAAAWPLDIDNYRSFNAVAGTLTIYHGAPKIGTTLGSVAPPSGSTGP